MRDQLRESLLAHKHATVLDGVKVVRPVGRHLDPASGTVEQARPREENERENYWSQTP
jgi:hypothetical protein